MLIPILGSKVNSKRPIAFSNGAWIVEGRWIRIGRLARRGERRGREAPGEEVVLVGGNVVECGGGA